MAWLFALMVIIYLTSVEGFCRSFNRRNKYTVSKSTTFDFISLLIGEEHKTDYALELIRNLAPLALPVTALAYVSAIVDRQIACSKDDMRQFKEFTDKQLANSEKQLKNSEEDMKQFKEYADKELALKKKIAKALLQEKETKITQTLNDFLVELKENMVLKNHNTVAKPADKKPAE